MFRKPEQEGRKSGDFGRKDGRSPCLIVDGRFFDLKHFAVCDFSGSTLNPLVVSAPFSTLIRLHHTLVDDINELSCPLQKSEDPVPDPAPYLPLRKSH